MYGPYSSLTQKLPSLLSTKPSLSIAIALPPGPAPPNPSPWNVATGSGANPGNWIEPTASGSRPVVGVPLGPVKRIVSR